VRIKQVSCTTSQAIHALVLWQTRSHDLRRKIGFGNRSADGELAVARLLAVSRTCQLQQINALVYLTAAIGCHRRRQAVASLLLPKRLTPCYAFRVRDA
jgi:hypothetical protein